MTSRERVLMALDHREPDRVPLDLGGSFVTGIAATSLRRLRRHLGLECRTVKVFDTFQMLGEVEMDLVERFAIDCLPVEPPSMGMGLRNERWKPWVLMDGSEVLVPGDYEIDVTAEGDWLAYAGNDRSRPPTWRMPHGGYYFDTIGYGDFHMEWEPPAIESIRAQSRGWIVTDEVLGFLSDRARQLRASTDKALVLGTWGYTGLHYVGTLPDWWALLAADPGYVRELFDLCTEVALGNLELLWDAVGGNADLLTITGLDFGTQRSEWFSPEAFEELYMPGLRRQFVRGALGVGTREALLQKLDNHFRLGALGFDAIGCQGLFNAQRKTNGGGHGGSSLRSWY